MSGSAERFTRIAADEVVALTSRHEPPADVTSARAVVAIPKRRLAPRDGAEHRIVHALSLLQNGRPESPRHPDRVDVSYLDTALRAAECDVVSLAR